MKKIKLFTITIFTVGVMALGTACSSGSPNETTPTTQITVAPTEAITSSEEETKTVKESNSNNEERQMIGEVDQNKGFMFTLKADDGEVYALNVTDEDMTKNIKSGDKLIITYTGETPDPTDVTDTVIVKIEKVDK